MAEDYQGLTPPPELVEEWASKSARTYRENGTYAQHELHLAAQAARWGADQELEACCEWLRVNKGTCFSSFVERDLRAARRPKPPSLKEQALEALARFSDEVWCEEVHADFDLIQRALEQLND